MTAPGPQARVALCTLDEFDDDRCMVDLPDGDPVLVIRHQGRIFAVDAMCPHQYAPLIGGDVEDHVLVCPLHGWRFDVRTGLDPGNPWCRIRTFGVEVEGGVVYWLPPASPAAG